MTFFVSLPLYGNDLLSENSLLFLDHETSSVQYLQPGQIQVLYIWVHPAWWSISSDEIQIHKEFIDALADAPRAALVQVPWNFSNSQFKGPFDSNGAVRNDIELLLDLNRYARNVLGERFALLPNKFKFVDGDNDEIVNLLKAGFNLPEPGANFFGDRTLSKIFNRIVVYGKEPDTCAWCQATSMNLDKISHSVRHLYNETPDEALPYPESYAKEMAFEPNWNSVGHGIYFDPSNSRKNKCIEGLIRK